MCILNKFINHHLLKVLHLTKYIIFFFVLFFFSFPSYSQQSLTAQEASSAFKEAISLYKQKRFSQSLLVLGEIRRRASDWRPTTIEKYITKCGKNINKKREEKMNTAQDNWLELLTSEEYDQPINAPVEVLFTEYKGLRTQLENKKVRLKYLGNQLKKVQTDSVFKIKNLERKDAVSKGKIQELEKQLSGIGKKIQELEHHKETNLKELKNKWETKIQESSTLIDKKNLELTLLEEKTKHLTSVVEEAKSLKEENDLLIRQIEKLRKKIKTPKIIYKPDPEQEKTIKNITKRVSSLETLSQRVTKENKDLSGAFEKVKEALRTKSTALEIKNKEISHFKDTIQQLEIENEKVKTTYTPDPEQKKKIEQQSKRIKILENLNQEILSLNENLLRDLKELQEKFKKSEIGFQAEREKSQLSGILFKNKDTTIKQLNERINELQQKANASLKIREKIVYKVDRQQENKINNLAKEINRLNETTIRDLKEMEARLGEKDEIIRRLKHIISTVYSRIEDLSLD